MTNDDDQGALDVEAKKEILRQMRRETIYLWLVVVVVASVAALSVFLLTAQTVH